MKARTNALSLALLDASQWAFIIGICAYAIVPTYHVLAYLIVYQFKISVREDIKCQNIAGNTVVNM